MLFTIRFITMWVSKFFLSLIFLISLAHAVSERVELEYKLFLPVEIEEKVYQWLGHEFARGNNFGVGGKISHSKSDERFRDVYYDTPSLDFHKSNSSIRFRRRVNLTNANDKKNGRMLVQMKLSSSGNASRIKGEVKFRAKNKAHYVPDGTLTGKLKKYELPRYVETVKALGFDPYGFKRIVTLEQLRRRYYLYQDGQIFMTVTFDRGEAREMFGDYAFCEIEIEINENLYTLSDESRRKELASYATLVSQALLRQFHTIHENKLSKYSYAVEHYLKASPLLFWLKRYL